MAAQGTAVKSASIDTAFATSQAQIYANNPFYGAIFRVQNGQEAYLQYVEKKDRLTLSKFLEQKNISQGRFMLKVNAPDGHLKEIPIVVDKNADLAETHPFLSNMPAPRQAAGPDKTIENSLKTEIDRLQKERNRAEDKRRDAEDELSRLKRDGSSHSTEKAIAHQQEITRLKETHSKEKEELKDELSELKMDLKLKELEVSQGSEGWEKVINKVLDGDILSNVAQQVGAMMQQQGNVQPTPAQMQQAIQQSTQTGNTGQAANKARNNPEKSQSAHPQPEPQPEPQPQSQTPEQVKAQFVAGLKNAALEALTADNESLKKYANAVRSQMALLKQQGITLNAAQWVQMAKILSERAVQEEITAERVAAVIEPVLSGVPAKTKMMLGMISPKAAANQLFSMFNIEVNETVKGLVIKVLTVLKNAK